jgi:hypothetical protein
MGLHTNTFRLAETSLTVLANMDTFFQQLAISGQTYSSPAQLYSARQKHERNPGYSRDKQQNGSYAITNYYQAED